MIINEIIWPVAIVSLTSVNLLEINLNKHDYTTLQASCQTSKTDSSIKYNYITTEEYLQSLINKYQDINP